MSRAVPVADERKFLFLARNNTTPLELVVRVIVTELTVI